MCFLFIFTYVNYSRFANKVSKQPFGIAGLWKLFQKRVMQLGIASQLAYQYAI
jgi:hypothetical protein